MTISTERNTYSRADLTVWAQKLNRDPNYKLETLEEAIKADPVAALAEIQRKQLGINPWGNLGLHYSWHKTLSLAPEELFRKIVIRGHGGYCMENNEFLATVLRSLGYELYQTGARICQAINTKDAKDTKFGGWSHEVIIVTIEGKAYVADVGLGSANPLGPILLEEGATGMTGFDIPQRLSRKVIEGYTTSQKMWVLETLNTRTQEWYMCNSFSEFEWLPYDFVIVNYQVSHDSRSWFTHRFCLNRIILDDKLETVKEQVAIMRNEVTRRMRDNKEVIVCKTEEERVEALEKYFDIVLLPEEKRGILGTGSAILG